MGQIPWRNGSFQSLGKSVPSRSLLLTYLYISNSFDEEIQEKFGDLMRQARTTELDSWEDQPKSTLSLLILTDQFPRNVWRNTPDAFSCDHKALDIASRAVIKGFDREVTPFQQLFFYLPFVHSESTTSQVAAMALFEGAIKRIDDPESEEAKLLNRSLGFAKGHAVPIAKFGRFPSRNVALGRETTKEEEEFLKEHPSGF